LCGKIVRLKIKTGIKMKNSFLILFASFVLILTACSTQQAATNVATLCPASIYDEGVVINGVRWATRNVDAPGTFAAMPMSAGKFYLIYQGHWQAWTLSGTPGTLFPFPPRSGPDALCPIGPCPKGWRLPTEEEFRSLKDAGSEAVRMGGVYGRLFGTVPNQIFLPVGLGPFDTRSVYGSYSSWDNRMRRIGRGFQFSVVSDFMRFSGGGSVRCVAE
jgi:hypothetical protein